MTTYINTESPSIVHKHIAEDRAKFEAELAACLDGSWPRNVGDRLRYHLPVTLGDTPAEANEKDRRYVARLCRQEIKWLDTKVAYLNAL